MIAAVILLVTGRYPEQIFDFVLGLNRWVLRVASYAGLMTDRYPPFRLDMGGRDPGTLTLQPTSGSAPQDLPGAADLRQAPPPGPVGWTGGRIVSAVAGAVLVLCSVGLFGGSGVALWAQTNRHDGYANLATATYSVPGYAIASDTIGLHLAAGAVSDLIGTVRIQVTQASGTAPAFIGIAPAGAAARYLAGVDYATVRGAAGHHGTYTEHAGSAPAVPPGQAGIWTAHASGPGTQTLTWAPRSGDWMVVAMNADGSRPASLQVNVAATLPALPWIAAGLLIGRHHLPDRRRPADRGSAAAGVPALMKVSAASMARPSAAPPATSSERRAPVWIRVGPTTERRAGGLPVVTWR